MSLPVPTFQRVSTTGSSSKAPVSANSPTRERKSRAPKSLTPNEYAKAVRGYSVLPAGQNHIALGEYLTNEPTSIDYHPQPFLDNFVTIYPLGPDDDVPALSPPLSSPLGRSQTPDGDTDGDSVDERRHETPKSISFPDPDSFFSGTASSVEKQRSCIIFMRGFMSAAWISNVGARYVVDPEFFCRHLDFGAANDNSNLSTPALPSSSWYLIELPVMTIGMRMAPEGSMRLENIAGLRLQGEEALASHHHRIAKLSSSDMKVGESMVRDYYVFDETHFVVEQRISICMQPAENGNAFTLLVWLDSSVERAGESNLPWAVHPPESSYLPVILHKYMIALKCHLFTNESDSDPSARSAAHLSTDYGRSLRSNIMAQDAFYSLDEVFRFVASSQMEFLNLVDIKLDKYTSRLSSEDFQSLPNLKYTKQVLYRYIQKTQRVLDSIRNAQQHDKWLRDTTDSGSRRATAAAQSLERDFGHLLDFAQVLHQRTTEAITVLMSSISISESQKAIKQAQRLAKLTVLAFFFVPLSFTTSFFGMNIREVDQSRLHVGHWFALSAPVTLLALALYYLDLTIIKHFGRKVIHWLSGILAGAC